MIGRLVPDKGVPIELAPKSSPVSLEEARSYVIEVEDVIEARVRGVELRRGQDGAFRFPTGFAVGETSLWLKTKGGKEHEIAVQIAPSEEKLDAKAWEQMLKDLHEWLRGVTAGVELTRHGAVAGRGALMPWLIEALEPLVEPLERALRRIFEDPRARSRVQLEELPLHRVRRADPETLRWFSRQPLAFQALRGQSEGRPPLVPQWLTRDIVDHPANRYLAWLVWRIVARMRETAQKLETVGKRLQKSDGERAETLFQRATSLRHYAERIERLWRRGPLAALRGEAPSEAALAVFHDDPRYARVLRLAKLFLSPCFTVDDVDELAQRVSLRPSYDLYELWTFYATERLLREALPKATWSREGFDKLLNLDASKPQVVFTAHLEDDGRRGELRLLFQPRFPSYYARGRSDRYSLSKERYPDLVIAWTPAVAMPGAPAWICLDAKYRVKRAYLADAFESLHIYRDSLRYESFGGRCRAGWLLVPAEAMGSEHWFSPEFFEKYALAAVRLRPGEPPPEDFARRVLQTLGVPLNERPIGSA